MAIVSIAGESRGLMYMCGDGEGWGYWGNGRMKGYIYGTTDSQPDNAYAKPICKKMGQGIQVIANIHSGYPRCFSNLVILLPCPGDSWHCLQTCLVVPAGDGSVTGNQWIEAKEAA